MWVDYIVNIVYDTSMCMHYCLILRRLYVCVCIVVYCPHLCRLYLSVYTIITL